MWSLSRAGAHTCRSRRSEAGRKRRLEDGEGPLPCKSDDARSCPCSADVWGVIRGDCGKIRAYAAFICSSRTAGTARGRRGRAKRRRKSEGNAADVVVGIPYRENFCLFLADKSWSATEVHDGKGLEERYTHGWRRARNVEQRDSSRH